MKFMGGKKMCSMCLQTPCNPRCPNADEPKAIHTCGICKEGIFAGMKFYTTYDGKNICEECLDEMSAKELLELMNERLEEANE